MARFTVNLNVNSHNNRYQCSENTSTFNAVHLHDLNLCGVMCCDCEGMQNHRVHVI